MTLAASNQPYGKCADTEERQRFVRYQPHTPQILTNFVGCCLFTAKPQASIAEGLAGLIDPGFCFPHLGVGLRKLANIEGAGQPPETSRPHDLIDGSNLGTLTGQGRKQFDVVA